ncbi:MAG: hypothetical protein JNK82_02695 [Myxococcaceae bacterium]|nr:hypothetical protein [Myxococcaceae bacterium]
MLRLTPVAIALCALTAFAEPPAGPQVIHTRDGRELRGTVTSETAQGYVLDTGETVLFSDIQDMLPAESPPPAVAPPPPPPPMPAPEPGTQPVYEGTPPPPERSPDEPLPEEHPVPDWRSERRGFHWSIGAGGMVDPGLTSAGTTLTFNVAGFVGAMGTLRWGFGWLDLVGELMPMGYFKGNTRALFVGFNPQMRVNFAKFYSLGVGLYSAVVLSPGVDFCIGPSFSPAIFRFGPAGEHEIRLWFAQPVIGTTPSLSANSGLMLMMLSYSYVF